MRFPFVSRVVLDMQHTAFRTTHDRLTKDLDNERAEKASLLEKYHALRLVGASIPEQPHFEEPVMPPEILMRAIREVSPTQDHAYSMNYQWAMALRDHWDDDGKMREAAQQIRYGSAYTPDMDDDT